MIFWKKKLKLVPQARRNRDHITMTKSVSFAPDDELVKIYIYNLCPDLSVRKDGLDLSTVNVIRREAKHRTMGNYIETMDIMRVCIYKPYRHVYFEAEAKALSLPDPCYFVIGSLWLRVAGRDPRPEEAEEDTEVESDDESDWVHVECCEAAEPSNVSALDLVSLLPTSAYSKIKSMIA